MKLIVTEMRLFVILSLSLISSVMSECVGVVDISCGGSACVALMTDDTAVAWGEFQYGW